MAATDDGIVMVEAGATQASEAEVLAAIEFGHESCRKITAGIRELVAKAGKPKRVHTPPAINQEMYDKIAAECRAELERRAQHREVPQAREPPTRSRELQAKAVESFPEEQKAEAANLFERLKERIFRDEMLDARRRPDGRAFDEIRQHRRRDRRPAPHARLRRCSPAARRRRW